MDTRSEVPGVNKQRNIEIKDRIRKFAVSSRIFVIILQVDL